MNPAFADTSYYLALCHEDDEWHERAVRWSQRNARPIVLTEFILLELGNALAPRAYRAFFESLVRSLRDDRSNLIIPVSHELFEQGFHLFAQRPDKDWSLTDCTSFVVMKQLRLTDALTADRHFEQAGFTVLLK